MINALAIISCIILTFLAVFQFALIFGAPLGNYAWGGTHKILPVRLKIGSLISIALYCIFAIVILSKTGLVALFENQAVINGGIWGLAVYFCIGVLMNGISRSKPERNLMTPITFALAIMTTIMAMY